MWIHAFLDSCMAYVGKIAELSSAYPFVQGIKIFGTLYRAYTVRNRNRAEIMKRRK